LPSLLSVAPPTYGAPTAPRSSNCDGTVSWAPATLEGTLVTLPVGVSAVLAPESSTSVAGSARSAVALSDGSCTSSRFVDCAATRGASARASSSATCTGAGCGGIASGAR
jgi:hypothetical protein